MYVYVVNGNFILLRALSVLIFLFVPRSFARQTDWYASGGLGITYSPMLVLFASELEYTHRPNVFLGPMLQLAVGDPGVLATLSASIRLVLGGHPLFRPYVVGGLGLAASPTLFDARIGLHIHAAMGFDYRIDGRLSLGTLVRLNFAPPLTAAFLSWPVLVARYKL